MKKTFTTQKSAREFIEQANSLLGFPTDDGSTLTYADTDNILEIISEENELVQTFNEVPIVTELDRALNPDRYDGFMPKHNEEGEVIQYPNEEEHPQDIILNGCAETEKTDLHVDFGEEKHTEIGEVGLNVLLDKGFTITCGGLIE